MKKSMYVFFSLFLVGMVSSCKEEETPVDVNTTASAEITVKNPSGGTEVNVNVYLFDAPPGASIDPTDAEKAAITDENGVVNFNLNDLTINGEEKTLYFAVLEESLEKEITLLGSLEMTLKKGEDNKFIEDLNISERELKYPNGFIPATISSSLAINEYNRMKSVLGRNCGDAYRIIADPSDETRVEAIGFGMLLAAYANDKTTFDGLFEFYKSKRTTEANNMMAWLVTCDDIEDPGSATDGDIDVAFSLVLADKQWGENYLDDAKQIINIIQNSLIQQCTVNGEEVNILAPGYSSGAWGGCEMTDIQYYTPAFFRVFADVTGETIWDDLADDTYILLNAAANDDTGLVPDWHTASGVPGPGGRNGNFGYDACRVPWRIALDYLWNGNQEAKAWCNQVSDWANGVGPANLVDGYELDGTPIGENGVNSAFLGGFSVSAMTNTPEMANKFATEMGEINDSYWFNLSTRVLYLFTMTGNFQKPE